MKKILISLLFLMPLTTFAGNLLPTTEGLVNQGFYAGMNVGKQMTSLGEINNVSEKYTTSDWATRLELGYISPWYLGVEVGGMVNISRIKYTNSYENDYNKIHLTNNIADALLTLNVPFYRLNLSLKGGGAALFDTTIRTFKDPNAQDRHIVIDDEIKTFFVPAGGASLGFHITNNILVNGEYIHYFKTNEIPAINYIGAGLQFIF